MKRLGKSKHFLLVTLSISFLALGFNLGSEFGGVVLSGSVGGVVAWSVLSLGVFIAVSRSMYVRL